MAPSEIRAISERLSAARRRSARGCKAVALSTDTLERRAGRSNHRNRRELHAESVSRRRGLLHFSQPPFQESALAVIAHQTESSRIGFRGLIERSHPAEHIGAGGMQQVIVVQLPLVASVSMSVSAAGGLPPSRRPRRGSERRPEKAGCVREGHRGGEFVPSPFLPDAPHGNALPLSTPARRTVPLRLEVLPPLAAKPRRSAVDSSAAGPALRE